MISLIDIYEWYLDLPEVKTLSSYKSLRSRLGNPVRNIGKNLRISELTLEHVRQYSTSRSKDKSPWGKCDHMSTATIHKEIGSLKAMLNMAVRYTKIEKNPNETFDKPSFLIYKHDFKSISHLSDELLGLLFRTICVYQNDKKADIEVDPRIELAFRFMKTRFDYDDQKYMKRVVANRLNAKKNSKNKEPVLDPYNI